MSVLIEFIPSLFIWLAFDFVLYLTGTWVLRALSFGLLKFKTHSYTEFKAHKSKSNQGLITPYIVGALFYVLLVFLIAWLN